MCEKLSAERLEQYARYWYIYVQTHACAHTYIRMVLAVLSGARVATAERPITRSLFIITRIKLRARTHVRMRACVLYTAAPKCTWRERESKRSLCPRIYIYTRTHARIHFCSHARLRPSFRSLFLAAECVCVYVARLRS